MTFGQRFARFATDVVVRAPFLWRLFRGPLTRSFDKLAPEWDATRVSPERLPPALAPLRARDSPRRCVPSPPRHAPSTPAGARGRLLFFSATAGPPLK